MTPENEDDEPTLFGANHYHGQAPHQDGADTSEESAAQTSNSYRAGAQAACYEHVKAQGLFGATCWDVEQATGLTHQSASARLRELSQDEDSPLWIIDKRMNPATGRRQRVYVTADIGSRFGKTRIDR